ncbi:hypothetical protein LD125_00464 [Mesoplasma sp. JKS002658]|uniref:DUF2178 domain-containing protein n=1 Tax=Mesoplasma whartonense TaxID=2878854 RepID=UPI002022AD2A|nr:MULTISPECIES: DUF2178 domain-containing protein [unclassified Mesoplasma]MCL8211418.1 hypothetical protein [Mesoplasma sp. JKS002664]MCL8212270.1 hypothetical protein [Mesoplasma sp. JKS002662]MCL8214201.1 hypothetical protein [Mesoplasma sp. JKS002658]MCL8214755.1 hypothetical protein [Mesoplasma sp. JKS002663]MCL8215520.1 hypothetical protein [Mesoplasma sp. JKS002659]
MIILIVIVAVIWTLGFTIGGAVMCSNNNSVGLVLCFLGSALIGLIIGLICLHKSSESVKDERYEKIITNQETVRKQNDGQIIKDLLKQNQELLQAMKDKENNQEESEEV